MDYLDFFLYFPSLSSAHTGTSASLQPAVSKGTGCCWWGARGVSTSVVLEAGLPRGGSPLLFELWSNIRCLTKALISSVSCCFSNWFRIQYMLMAILLRRLNGEEFRLVNL